MKRVRRIVLANPPPKAMPTPRCVWAPLLYFTLTSRLALDSEESNRASSVKCDWAGAFVGFAVGFTVGFAVVCGSADGSGAMTGSVVGFAVGFTVVCGRSRIRRDGRLLRRSGLHCRLRGFPVPDDQPAALEIDLIVLPC